MTNNAFALANMLLAPNTEAFVPDVALGAQF